MNHITAWKPLIITGAVLAINGLIFLLIGLATLTDTFLGPTAGCIGAGIALLIVGIIHRKKALDSKE